MTTHPTAPEGAGRPERGGSAWGPAPQHVPEPGELAYDSSADRVGIVSTADAGGVVLVPVPGGREWEADPADVHRPSADQRRQAAAELGFGHPDTTPTRTAS